MIYLFVWEKYFRDNLLDSWKWAFEKKYSSLNIIEIKDCFEVDINFYNQILFSTGFFSTKSLIIINDFPFEVWKSEDEIQEFESKDKLLNYFLENLEKVNEENIVVFNNSKVDKRSKLYKQILKIWEIKDFLIEDLNDLNNKLAQIYKEKVSLKAINKLIELKWLNFSSITNELDKLLITNDFVDIWQLNLVSKDIEENIFEIIDNILNLNIAESIKKLELLSKDTDNSYLLYNMICSNFRIYFYMFELKSIWKKSSEIKSILNLWNRWFLADKSYKISFKSFLKFYNEIIKIDEKIKTWNMFGSENIDMLYEIQKNILKINY